MEYREVHGILKFRKSVKMRTNNSRGFSEQK